MAAPLNSRTSAPDWPGMSALIGRLLEQAVPELADADDPVARLAAERCGANLAACAEMVGAAAHAGPAERGPLLRGAWVAVASARCDLELVHRRGAILPPSYRALVAGADVVRRRIHGALESCAGPRG